MMNHKNFIPFLQQLQLQQMPFLNFNLFINRVYLCIENDSNQPQIVGNFTCIKFSSFQEASSYYHNCYKFIKNQNQQKNLIRKTFVPFSIFVPEFLDCYLIDYDLKKKFWNHHHLLK